MTFFTVQEPHRKLEVTAINEVEVHPRPIPDPRATMPWEEVVHALETYRDAETLDAYQLCSIRTTSSATPRWPAMPPRPFLPGVPCSPRSST